MYIGVKRRSHGHGGLETVFPEGKTIKKSEEKKWDRGTEGETPISIPAIDALIGEEEQNIKIKRKEKIWCAPLTLCLNNCINIKYVFYININNIQLCITHLISHLFISLVITGIRRGKEGIMTLI